MRIVWRALSGLSAQAVGRSTLNGRQLDLGDIQLLFPALSEQQREEDSYVPIRIVGPHFEEPASVAEASAVWDTTTSLVDAILIWISAFVPPARGRPDARLIDELVPDSFADASLEARQMFGSARMRTSGRTYEPDVSEAVLRAAMHDAQVAFTLELRSELNWAPLSRRVVAAWQLLELVAQRTRVGPLARWCAEVAGRVQEEQERKLLDSSRPDEAALHVRYWEGVLELRHRFAHADTFHRRPHMPLSSENRLSRSELGMAEALGRLAQIVCDSHLAQRVDGYNPKFTVPLPEHEAGTPPGR